MRCGFCGHELTEAGIEKACRGCAAFGGCRLVKCPRCGYEQPQEPKWIRNLVNWARRKRQETARKPSP